MFISNRATGKVSPLLWPENMWRKNRVLGAISEMEDRDPGPSEEYTRRKEREKESCLRYR